MDNEVLKILVLLFVILYAISPFDALIGPIDDIIVIIMGYAAHKRLE